MKKPVNQVAGSEKRERERKSKPGEQIRQKERKKSKGKKAKRRENLPEKLTVKMRLIREKNRIEKARNLRLSQKFCGLT